jgi:hypothetical protein
MDGATEAHFKNLLRTIKFVLDTRNYSLVLKPHFEGPWKLRAFSDSDFGSDRDTRRSITGYIIFAGNVPIVWRSRAQRNVTLSSTEAEYVAVSEVCTELMFARQVLEFVGIKIALPIVVNVDNVGAIFLANNATTGGRTKHIDIRHHFVRECIEDGIVIIHFVKSEENEADPFTKNVSAAAYKKHSQKYLEAETVRNREGVGELSGDIAHLAYSKGWITVKYKKTVKEKKTLKKGFSTGKSFKQGHTRDFSTT